MCADVPELAETAASMKIETSQQLSAPIALEQPSLFAAAGQWIVRMSTTRANGMAGLVADVGTCIVLLGAGLWQGHARPLTAISTMLLGLLLFSFIEYGFHRWLFHGAPKIMEQGHRKHHERPDGYDALPFFLPPLGLLAIAGLLNLVLPAQFQAHLRRPRRRGDRPAHHPTRQEADSTRTPSTADVPGVYRVAATCTHTTHWRLARAPSRLSPPSLQIAH